MFLLLQLILQVSSQSPFFTEEIKLLQQELKILTKARSLLTQSESEDLLTLFPASDSHWSSHRIVPKSILSSDSSIRGACLISLKPMQGILHPSNLGLLVIHSSGLLELREVTGGALYRLDLGYDPVGVAASNSIDEVKFAVISQGKLEGFGVIIEKPVKPVVVEDLGVQTSAVFISLYKEFEVQLEGPANLVSLYIKSGKKFWAVGFEDGRLGLVGFNGKMESLNDLGYGKIQAFDRFGPFLVLTTGSETGPLNMNNWKINPSCNFSGFSLSLDATNTSSVVHVSDGESIRTFDFRSVKSEQFSCKGKKKLEIRKNQVKCSKIYSTKDFLACFQGGELKMIDTSDGKILNSFQVTEKNDGEGLVGFRTSSGDYYLLVFTSKELTVFEVFTGRSRSSGNFDSSFLKFALIGLVVVAVGYYQYSKAKKPKVSKDKKNN